MAERACPCGHACRYARSWHARPGAPAALLLLVLVLFWPQCGAAQDEPLELAIKATYLYKLPQFVTWPQAAIPPDAFVLCVVGERFGATLDRAVAGQTVQGRPIVVRRYRSMSGNRGCQLIYIGESDGRAGELLAAVRGTPVLTVTDGVTEDPGIINFVVVDGHIRFEIDATAAAANQLVLSSKLLAVAVQVRNGPAE